MAEELFDIECIGCMGKGKVAMPPYPDWKCDKCGRYMGICQKCRKQNLGYHRLYTCPEVKKGRTNAVGSSVGQVNS